jgi:excisionase family DNA binding protein
VVLTVRDVQGVVGISRETAYNLVNRRGFPAVRVGKQIRIPKDGLRRWLDMQSAPPEE